MLTGSAARGVGCGRSPTAAGRWCGVMDLLGDLLPPRAHRRWTPNRRAWEVAPAQLLPLVRALAEWFGVVTVDEVRTVSGATACNPGTAGPGGPGSDR